MNSTRNAGKAAIAGALLWLVGFTGEFLGELEYRAVIADNPLEAWPVRGATALGSILLIFALRAVQREIDPRTGPAGKAGYWISLAALVILLFPVWPMIFFGPVLLGIGLTVHAIAGLAARVASTGTWLHALAVPTGVAAGFAAYGIGLDGGFGIVTFLVTIIAGFAAYGTALLREDEPQTARPSTAATSPTS